MDSTFNTINTNTLSPPNTIGLTAIDVDTLQNVYLAGEAYNTSYNYCIAKYRPDGSLAWYNYHSGPGNSGASPADIKVNNIGEVFVTGFDRGIGTNEDVCTIKYDSVGNQIWINRFDTTGNDDFGHKIIFDKLGNVYVKGRMHVSNESYATIRYTTSGARLWSKTYNPYNQNDWAFDFCVDDSLSVYITGNTSGSGYPFDDNSRCTTIKYKQPNQNNNNNIKEDFGICSSKYFPIQHLTL